MDDLTLGGYMAHHDRAAAFTGSDGRPYSVGLYVEEEADERGRFAASLIFVCWAESGERPVGHVESPVLFWAQTPEDAQARLEALSLYDVKAELDKAIAEAPGPW